MRVSVRARKPEGTLHARAQGGSARLSVTMNEPLCVLAAAVNVSFTLI